MSASTCERCTSTLKKRRPVFIVKKLLGLQFGVCLREVSISGGSTIVIMLQRPYMLQIPDLNQTQLSYDHEAYFNSLNWTQT